jgi:PqqD family protein of HPr-rel-A system
MELNRIKNLALSETGFLFDPATGNTFTLNESAMTILKALKNGLGQQQIAEALAAEFEVSGSQAREDVSDALLQLREAGLIAAGAGW